MPDRASWTRLVPLVLGLLVAAQPASAQTEPASFPARVLLTNDDGIVDPVLLELGRAFARVPGTEVTVVAATRDRSGSSNFVGAIGEGVLRVQRADLDPGIEAWAVDGYPADGVIFALTGPLRDRPPDVVVSGINAGTNLADAWFLSGTIGAVRTAAFLGVPGVAVSGLDAGDAEAVRAATSWVVRLVQSELVASLRAPQYLTVSLPVGHPSDIRGVRVVERASGLLQLRAREPDADVDSSRDTASAAATSEWGLEFRFARERAPEGTDVAALADGFIAIVPMRVDENDPELAVRLRAVSAQLPALVEPESPP